LTHASNLNLYKQLKNPGYYSLINCVWNLDFCSS